MGLPSISRIVELSNDVSKAGGGGARKTSIPLKERAEKVLLCLEGGGGGRIVKT